MKEERGQPTKKTGEVGDVLLKVVGGDVHYIPLITPPGIRNINIPLKKALKMIFLFPFGGICSDGEQFHFFMNFQIEIKANFNFSAFLGNFKKQETPGDLLRMSTSSNSPSPLRSESLGLF